MSYRDHWEHVYRAKRPDEVSWYQQAPLLTLRMVASTRLPEEGAIIDVGGGASNLVDALLRAGYRDVTVLDIAGAALEHARDRLGDRASDVKWVRGDVTEMELCGPYDLWHDRAVFHFLTQPAARARYREQLLRYLKPGGHALIATFAPEGPEQCSGLPVKRYSPEELVAELGDAFELMEAVDERHRTPSGGAQAFIYCWLRRRSV